MITDDKERTFIMTKYHILRRPWRNHGRSLKKIKSSHLRTREASRNNPVVISLTAQISREW